MNELKIYFEEFDSPSMQMSELDQIKVQMLSLLAEKIKYKLMWQLRHLEKEFTEDGGYIKIRSDTKLEVKVHSAELMEKIAGIVQSFKP
ncbi:MAG TPA: hypothetical protein VNV35_12915 [Puia sp.]|jgi:hypothetical protein|nr:hypothetical protein [Puia sp.]